jgi:hypothetical protein
MAMMEEQPRLLVTFETAAPLFQRVLTESLKAAGFTVEVGLPTVEQRGAGGETVEALKIDIDIQGEGLTTESAAQSAIKVARIVRNGVKRRHLCGPIKADIHGPPGVFKMVRLSARMNVDD